MASSQPQNAAVTSAGRQVNPSEVGWQFVPQYYTFVNKHPNRLHCFYTKNSTFIHGTEGEDGKPCYGQQEIHAKILSLDYNDCKVFIHSVDAQSSANNGIIIQVIGEMSNRGEPWKKFVQTFFLAEQPNGYFVLNDIFRFLKEDTAGEEEEEEETVIDGPPAQVDSSVEPSRFNEPEQIASPAPTAPVEQLVNSYEPEHPTPQPIPHPVAAPPQIVVERQPTPGAPTPAEPQPVEEPKPEESHVNGINGHADENESVDEKSEAAVDSVHVESEPEPIESITTVVEPAVEQTLVPIVKAPSPAPAPDTALAISTPNVPAAQPTPEPAPVPSEPKTWATLAASSSRKWGNQIATEAKGVSAAAPQAPSPVHAQPKSFPNGKASGGDAAQQVSVTTGQCFVKSVTDNVQENILRETLASRFGAIKDLELVRNKACAFLEFVTADAARKAIIASLPISQGGEGGIRLEGKPAPNGLPPRVIVETRKERGDRPISNRGRGGPPGGGEGRGGFTGGASVGAGGTGEGRGGSGRGRGAIRGRGAPPVAK